VIILSKFSFKKINLIKRFGYLGALMKKLNASKVRKKHGCNVLHHLYSLRDPFMTLSDKYIEIN
jgi:hypothetical protein